MSQTIVLPVDTDNNGTRHKSRHSRGRIDSNRLTLPVTLARIASGEVATTRQLQQTGREESPNLDHHTHNTLPSHTGKSMALHSSRVQVNSRSSSLEFGADEKRRSHTARKHIHRDVSAVTDWLLHQSEQTVLLHSILADKESRRIFYFMCLNLAFMAVQSTYGYLTGSLGLISDSIHMFFDCVALLVGMCATVMSKWPPSIRFPYGYGKIDTLAGLGNGVFLMLISIEIVYEAIERLFTGSDLSRTTELLVVSILGFSVNLVGILAFHGAHDHHGHDHHGHGENMQGIYLHIMADALGSIAVIISTLLVRLTGWSGWDPLASCIIAILIFASTIPLISSSIRKLLLSLSDDVEYNLRDAIGGLMEIRGVSGYSVPKFWLEDIKPESHNHNHDHDHDHLKDSASGTSEAADHTCAHSHAHPHNDNPKSPDRKLSHSSQPRVLGTIHIQVHLGANMLDVQQRVSTYFTSRNMHVIVQYEREGDLKCWCIATLPEHTRRPGSETPIQATFGHEVGSSMGTYGGYRLSEKGSSSPLRQSKML